jgi:hypothetical protein
MHHAIVKESCLMARRDQFDQAPARRLRSMAHDSAGVFIIAIGKTTQQEVPLQA